MNPSFSPEPFEDPSIEQTPNPQYQKLIEYVDRIKDQGFSWVYRGEGVVYDDSVSRSGNNQHLRGSWFTETFAVAEDFKHKEESEGREAKIYAIMVPNAMLNMRDPLSKGMNGGEINIINPTLRDAKFEVTEPLNNNDITPEAYIDQFNYPEYL